VERRELLSIGDGLINNPFGEDKRLSDVLDEVAKSPEYKEKNDEDRIDALRHVFTRFRRAATAQLKRELDVFSGDELDSGGKINLKF